MKKCVVLYVGGGPLVKSKVPNNSKAGKKWTFNDGQVYKQLKTKIRIELAILPEHAKKKKKKRS
jgi:hypothetical protein